MREGGETRVVHGGIAPMLRMLGGQDKTRCSEMGGGTPHGSVGIYAVTMVTSTEVSTTPTSPLTPTSELIAETPPKLVG